MSQEPPGWVRVVVPERDGRSLFVGGVALAVDPESGIEEAAADARSQIHLAATKRFIDLFTLAVRESGIETTAMERLDLKNAITGDYGLRMAEAARQDSVFYRPCGETAGAAAPAAGGSGAPVCQVFVLMSLDARDWGSKLGELLAVQKRRRTEEGEAQLAEFAGWLTRQAIEDQPEGAEEHSR
ncbi:MAG: hypothetical protein ABIE42_11375 [Candidatus Eisenbacteria bacterium]